MDHRLAAVHVERSPATGADRVVGDGEDDQLDLLDERRRRRRRPRTPGTRRPEPLAAARVPARDGVDRPAGPVRATPRAVPTAPAPTIPMTGGSPGALCDVGMAVRSGRRGRGVAARGRRGRGPAPVGSRSIPACLDRRGASRSRSLGRAARPASPQAFIAGPPAAVRDRSAVLFHAASVPSDARRRTRGRLPIRSAPGRASGPGLPDLYRLAALGDRIDLDRAPVTLKILLENVLRHAGGGIVEAARRRDARRRGGRASAAEAEVPFMPARVILQDFTGVPAIVDLAVMRDAMADLGGDPALVNPLVPADLVIDHSVQVDRFGTPAAFAFNVEREYERNGERYQLLRWAQTAFRDLRVVPPGTGHRPPGQPRVPRDGRRPTRRRRRAAGSPTPTRSSGPTRTRRWSTPSASSATASAGSRPRRCSSASRSTSRCRGSSASGSTASCRRARPRPTSSSS